MLDRRLTGEAVGIRKVKGKGISGIGSEMPRKRNAHGWKGMEAMAVVVFRIFDKRVGTMSPRPKTMAQRSTTTTTTTIIKTTTTRGGDMTMTFSPWKQPLAALERASRRIQSQLPPSRSEANIQL